MTPNEGQMLFTRYPAMNEADADRQARAIQATGTRAFVGRDPVSDKGWSYFVETGSTKGTT